MPIVLGAIADDFTGATDLANTWVKEGVRVVQVIGVPDNDIDLTGAEAVVVALKSRTAPVEAAVAQSRAALAWLQAQGADQILFKYCSTFDSTARGNIGPVADALMADLGVSIAPVCPAFPANGRTVYQGTLFVWDLPLAESSMKDHPLTPMRDSNLMRLMSGQSRHAAGLVPFASVRDGATAVRAAMDRLTEAGQRYAVVDALDDDDLRTIGRACKGMPLVTGGSGVGMGLPANLREDGKLGSANAPEMPKAGSRALVIAGSCSAATRAQIGAVQDRWPTRKIDPDRLAEGSAHVQETIDWAMAQPSDTPVLVYASADPAEVAAAQARHGTEKAGNMVEQALADVAQTLAQRGVDRIVVAGGETSGAVVSALGVQSLRIGPEIAPGVPWTEAQGDTRLALALKSGNFGGTEFFNDAFGMFP
ncbi:four-carbon acid sugar kinase family protein [Mameliella alba]|nr:four-carbon acid sugar kinase family protein [Antarctobacter heliothermus]MBY6143689.1 four-carbon acid sugar kinase family protein [Mameliella alba]MCA0952587.1 four-carbon acid sugar kinase family protein [Mameliella alba]